MFHQRKRDGQHTATTQSLVAKASNTSSGFITIHTQRKYSEGSATIKMAKSTTSPAATRCKHDLGYSRTVQYSSSNNLSLICQKWGSVNRKVVPFCFVNLFICLILLTLLNYGIDLTISEFGHEFMRIILAFLVINKLSFTLGMYYEVQGHLSSMNQAVIDTVQLACAFTNHKLPDGHKRITKSSYRPEAEEMYRQYRFEISRQSLILLKATVSVVHKGGEHNVWEMAEFGDDPLLLHVPGDTSPAINNSTDEAHGRVIFPTQMYIMGQNLKSDLNLRVPIRVAQRMRDHIMKHRNLPEGLNPMQEMQLIDLVKDFITGYRGIRKYLTTPLPLPLVQLARIFVFAYVFTLPFALLSAELELKDIQVVLLVLLMTYGFIGCELLFVELDDPFGEDPNDLPLVEEARAAYDDIVLSLYQADGMEAALKLRKAIQAPSWASTPYEFYSSKVARNQTTFPRMKETDPLLANIANSK